MGKLTEKMWHRQSRFKYKEYPFPDTGCAKLDDFIVQCQIDCEASIDFYKKTQEDLVALAKAGNCQFDRRCSKWKKCPMAKQGTHPWPRWTHKKIMDKSKKYDDD